MEGKNPLQGKLIPELPGGRPDTLQLKTEFHGAKIISLHVAPPLNYMETINWKVEGMSCSTCALTIGKYLEKKGLQNVRVSLASGDISFDTASEVDRGQLQKGITDLGYTVIKEDTAAGGAGRAPL